MPKKEIVLKSRWTGLDKARTALQFVKPELRKSRLNRGVRLRLQKFYGITL